MTLKKIRRLEKITAPNIQAKIITACLSIITFAAAVMFAGGLDLCSAANAGQWPFEPGGYFFPQEGLPADLDHITLLRNDKEGDVGPVPGVYTARGKLYKFASLRTGGWPDFRKIYFEFTTIAIDVNAKYPSGKTELM